MNKKKILTLLTSLSFFFAACGDSDSPSSPNKNPEEITSSSEDADESSSSTGENAKSSSSVKDNTKSSSSKTDSKSSSSVGETVKSSSSAVLNPSGSRIAKLEDLEKNMEIDLFGVKIYLSTGSKQGFFALRIPDELWVVSYQDFANGQIAFARENVGVQYSDSDNAKKIRTELESGFKILFVVDKDGKLKYAVNDSKTFNDVVKAQVAVQSGIVSKAETIVNKIYTCTDADTTKTFTFFDNSYILEYSNAQLGVFWFLSGHYDVQRSTLLSLPTYFHDRKNIGIPTYSMYSYQVGSEDNKITTYGGDAMNCTVKNNDSEYAKTEDYVGDWQKLSDGANWTFSIKADGTYILEAVEGGSNTEYKEGTWEIYGNYFMMRNKVCRSQSCTPVVYGKLNAGKRNSQNKLSGFSFIHDDPDTPKIPKSFDAIEYE